MCINDDFPEELRKTTKLPKVGETYSIRSIQPSLFGSGYIGLTLEGLDNRSAWFGVKNGYVPKELCFASFRFMAVDLKEASRSDEYRIGIYEPTPVSMNLTARCCVKRLVSSPSFSSRQKATRMPPLATE